PLTTWPGRGRSVGLRSVRELGLTAGYQPDAGQHAQQLLEHDPEFQPGQVGAQAEVSTESERHVVVVLPRHLEAVWVVEGPVVGVSGPVHEEYLVTVAQRLAVQLVVHGHRPAHVEDGRRVPDELLHCRRGDDRRVGHQDLALIRKAREVSYRLPDDRPRGLRPAVEQQQALLDYLGDLQRLAVNRAVYPGRHQVIARAGPAGRNQLTEGGREFADRRRRAGRLAGVVVPEAGRAHRPLRPFHALAPLRPVESQQLGDDHRRQRRGELGDHLGGPFRRDRGDQLGGDGPHALRVPAHRAGRAPPGHQLALAQVPRVVPVDHRSAHLDERAAAPGRAVARGVALDGQDVLVP